MSTDNMAIVQVWRSGSCKNKDIMSLVRRLFFFIARRNVNLLLKHVPGKLNVDADLCSRLQVDAFMVGEWLPQTKVVADVWNWLA